MKSPNLLLSALLAASVTLSGCAGYKLGDAKPGVYSGIRKIHVPPFKNLTLEPRLSSLVTNAVLIEMQGDGTYQVASKNDCDAVLVGRIKEVQKRQLRAVRTDTLRSRELSIYLLVDFHLVDPVTGARIDSTPSRGGANAVGKDTEGEEIYGSRQGLVIGETIQYVDASYQVGERSAFAVAAEDAAKKLVSQLANGW